VTLTQSLVQAWCAASAEAFAHLRSLVAIFASASFGIAPSQSIRESDSGLIPFALSSNEWAKWAHAIRNRWPPIALIVTVGTYAAKGSELPTNVHFPTKPYKPTDLTDAVQRLTAACRGEIPRRREDRAGSAPKNMDSAMTY
jgi:hypothetical protein